MFHPGQHVLCVESFDDIAAAYPTLQLPAKGTVYTVRDTLMGIPAGRGRGREYPGVHLDEIRNDPLPEDAEGGFEPGFAVECFRPLSSSALDVFRRVAAPKTREVA